MDDEDAVLRLVGLPDRLAALFQRLAVRRCKIRGVRQGHPTLWARAFHKSAAGLPAIQPQGCCSHPFRRSPTGGKRARDRARKTNPYDHTHDSAYGRHDHNLADLLAPRAPSGGQILKAGAGRNNALHGVCEFATALLGGKLVCLPKAVREGLWL